MHALLVAIVGPTAIGKSSVAFRTAQLFDGEIVSVDSMQVYRGMDIGTAKPGPAERAMIPHHLIDIASPYEDFSVAVFQASGRKAIDGIIERGGLPVLVGGSGLYLKALVDKMEFPLPYRNLRDKYYSMPEEEAKKHAYEELVQTDAEAAERIGPYNLRRLVRALEIRRTAENPPCRTQRTLADIEPHYPRCLIIGLTAERTLIYQRIDRRVDKMFRDGLVEEARRLRMGGELSATARQALGYRQVYEYLDRVRGLDETIQLIKTSTRRFAKRQMTWFRGEARVRWLALSEDDLENPSGVSVKVARMIERALKEKG